MEYKGYTIKIMQDECPDNPREAWDHLCYMVCWHRRYLLGDKHSWDVDEFKEFVIRNRKDMVIMPLYLYDHSGITISTGPFSCPWDSGQVGYIYVMKNHVREQFGWKAITAKRMERIKSIMKAEVSEYDDYLTGNVYGWTIEETGDSCWGYYGDPDGYCLDEAKGFVDHLVKKEIKDHLKDLRNWIKNDVPVMYRKPCPITR